MSREIIAVIPAAGVGSRMQANKPKQYLKILDKTILEHTLSVILSHPAINHVILAVGKNDPYLSEMTLFPHQNITLVEGGESRAESVLNGLKAIKNNQAWVLVHDAARPCLTHQDLDKLLQIDDEQGAIWPFQRSIRLNARINNKILLKQKIALNFGLHKHLNFFVAIY